MTTPHKYRDAIIAWAEGKAIQVRRIGRDNWHTWNASNYCDTPKFHDADFEFRPAPEPRYQWLVEGEQGRFVCSEWRTFDNAKATFGKRLMCKIEETRRDG